MSYIGNTIAVQETWLSDTPPSDKSKYTIWVNTTTGKTFNWYDDGGTSQWIQDVAQSEGNILSNNSVNTNQLVNGSVTEPKLDVNGLQIVGLLPTAWCVFNGTFIGTNAPIAGYNISSVERISTGNYIVNLTDTFDNTNYSVVATAQNQSADSTLSPLISENKDIPRNTTTVRIIASSYLNAVINPLFVSVYVYGGRT